MNNGERYQAWKDSLPQDRVDFIERLEAMPPQMAIGYAVENMRAEMLREIDEIKRPLWRQAIAPIGAAAAVVVAYFDPNLPRPH